MAGAGFILGCFAIFCVAAVIIIAIELKEVR